MRTHHQSNSQQAIKKHMASIKAQNATISNTLFARNVVCDSLDAAFGPVTKIITGDSPVAANRFVDLMIDGLNAHAVEGEATPVNRCIGVSRAAAAAGALVPITVMGVVDVEVHPSSANLLAGSPVFAMEGGYATATATAGQIHGYVIGQGVAAGAGGLISVRVLF